MPEGGEGAVVVVPGGSEVGTSTVGGVQTPSRLGGGGHTHIHMYTHVHTRHGGVRSEGDDSSGSVCNQLAAILEGMSWTWCRVPL